MYIADPTDSHDKAGKYVETRRLLSASPEHDENSGVNSIFLESLFKIVGRLMSLSLKFLYPLFPILVESFIYFVKGV
jgi:hypothetical protein